MLSVLALLLTAPTLAEDDSCSLPEAQAAFEQGFAAQQSMQTETALAAYARCLELEPDCAPCQYEVGWTHWTRGDWDAVVEAWERTLALDPSHKAAATWLPSARDQGEGGPALSASGLRIPLGTTSRPADARVGMELVARWQNYNAHPGAEADHHDQDVYSPKSARFTSDGSRVYVNSLEGFKTLVFDPSGPTKLGVIEHQFDAEDEALFHGQSTVFEYPYHRRSPAGDPNSFSGKPVESALSHRDRWLWIPYYRRDFDYGATSPSAVSIVDTKTDEIVRVLPTGPIPKYVAISPDDRWAAITHWGDNTLGVVDISSGDPQTFRYLDERLVVERVLSQEGLAGTNRDGTCGSCLRGTVFSPGSDYLLVARMGDGGIAGFRVEDWTYLGTLGGEPATPRHLVVSPDGEWLYLSSNRSGYVSRIPLRLAIERLEAAAGQVVVESWERVHVGSGARTLEVTQDGRWLFAAVNGRSEVVAVDARSWEVVSRVRTDSYTVGLGVSPDGRQVWTTSQGRDRKGGNSVCVFEITYAEE